MRCPTGSTYRSPLIVCVIHVSTVRRKLPTITCSATSMPTATVSAATTVLARATASRSARAPSDASIPPRRPARGAASDDIASVAPGASSEKPTIAKNAAANPPHATRVYDVHSALATMSASATAAATPSALSGSGCDSMRWPWRSVAPGAVAPASSAGSSAEPSVANSPSPAPTASVSGSRRSESVCCTRYRSVSVRPTTRSAPRASSVPSTSPSAEPTTPIAAASDNHSRATAPRVMPSARSTPMSRRRRTTDIAIVLKMRNVLTNTAMNDSAVRLSANARTMFSTCFVRPCGSSAAAVGGSRRPSSARTESRRSGATSRSTRSRRPSRPKTSCAVAMSVITTLPPIACWSASDSITAAIVIGVGTPEASTVSESPTCRPWRAASVRVIAIVRGSASRRRPAAAACAASLRVAESEAAISMRKKGASTKASRPRTSSVSS